MSVGANELMARSGASFRAIDYWTRRGFIVADDDAPGSGRPRTWPESEVAVATRIQRLRTAGLALGVAVRAARGGEVVELAPGIFLTITDLAPVAEAVPA